MIERAFSSIVITAQTFNPSIFTETWLVKNEILKSDEELTGLRMFSPQIVQFQTSEVQALIIPQKMQITFPLDDDKPVSAVPVKLANKTAELLPHTPFHALGLNFEYFISPFENESINAFSRALFGEGNNKLINEFSSPTAKFGRYFSMDHGNARLKLNIKPVIAEPDKKEFILFSFNFHHDLQLIEENRDQKLIEFVKSWDSLKKYSQKLVKLGSENQVIQ